MRNEQAAYEEYERQERASLQDTLQSLHVDAQLSGRDSFHLSGNGMGKTLDQELVLRIGEPRKDKRPNKRTPKRDLSLYSRQDALEALVALANISELAAPYIWKENCARAEQAQQPVVNGRLTYRNDINPDRYLIPPDGINAYPYMEAEKVLRVLVSDFVEQFGFLHMPAKNKYGLIKQWVSVSTLRLLDKDHESLEAFRESINKTLTWRKNLEMKNGKDDAEAKAIAQDWWTRELERRGLTSVQDAYLEELSFFAKDFAAISSFKADRAILEEESNKIRKNIEDFKRVLAVAQTDEQRKDISDHIAILQRDRRRLSFGENDLIYTAQCARKLVNAETERDNEIWCIDIWDYYNASILLNDAINLYLAKEDDNDALMRITTKFHMEVFENKKGEPDDCYTLWFETYGHDTDNPGSERDHYEYRNRDTLLRRQGNSFDNECYGSGRKYFIHCPYGSNINDFHQLVKDNVGNVLDSLIREGVELNYKNRFAQRAEISRDERSILVNSFEQDLFSTLWSAMRGVVDGRIPFEVDNCSVCGRFILRQRKQAPGRTRATCGDACRQAQSRANRKNKGKNSGEAAKPEKARIRDEYLSFLTSPAAHRIGVVEHRLECDRPLDEPQPERQGFLAALKEQIRELRKN